MSGARVFEAGVVAQNGSGPLPRGLDVHARPPLGRSEGILHRFHCAMPTTTHLTRFTVPLGRQEIELAEVVHDAGGMRFLRIRIRERNRFTILDVDPLTAQQWGEAMRRWGEAQMSADAGGESPD